MGELLKKTNKTEKEKGGGGGKPVIPELMIMNFSKTYIKLDFILMKIKYNLNPIADENRKLVDVRFDSKCMLKNEVFMKQV